MGIPNPVEISEIVSAKQSKIRGALSPKTGKSAQGEDASLALCKEDIVFMQNLIKECFNKSLKSGYTVKLSGKLSEPLEQALRCYGYKQTLASKLLLAVLKEYFPQAKMSKDRTTFNCSSLDDRMGAIDLIHSDLKLMSGEHKLVLDYEITAVDKLIYELKNLNSSQNILTWYNASKSRGKESKILGGRTLEWLAGADGQNYLAEADFSLKGAARAGLECDEVAFPQTHCRNAPSKDDIAEIFRRLGFRFKVLDKGLEIALIKNTKDSQ